MAKTIEVGAKFVVKNEQLVEMAGLTAGKVYEVDSIGEGANVYIMMETGSPHHPESVDFLDDDGDSVSILPKDIELVGGDA